MSLGRQAVPHGKLGNRRGVALVLALLIWLGFSLIPIAVYAGVVR
jgi:hypothetical protein